MSYCAPNSHARHTILKGCCDSRSAYSAQKYCECNDTAGSNVLANSDRVGLCSILTASFTGQTFVNLTSTAFDLYIATINFNGVCGPLLILGFTNDEYELIGTVTNGIFTREANTLPDGDYSIYVVSEFVDTINNNVTGPCGTFTIDT